MVHVAFRDTEQASRDALDDIARLLDDLPPLPPMMAPTLPSVPLRHVLTDKLSDIRRMAMQGMTPPQIGARFGFSPRVLVSLVARFPEIGEAMLMGAAEGVDLMSAAAFRAAQAGDMQTTRWWLERRGDFQAAPTQVHVDLREQILTADRPKAAPITIEHIAHLQDQSRELLDSMIAEGEAKPSG